MNIKSLAARFGELIAGTLLLGGSIVFYMYYTKTDSSSSKKMSIVPVVKAEEVRRETLATRIEGIGTGIAKESVDLTAGASEKVVRVNFEDGQYVKEGTLLIQLDDTQEQAELGQALVNLSEQERELQRITPLYNARITSQKEFNERETMLAKAKAMVEVVRAQIRDRQVAAPFTGLLGMRKVSVGDLVTPGTVVTTIDDISDIKVDFNVPEKYIARLKTGQNINVSSAAYPGETFKGTISAISTRVSQTTRSVEVRGVIANKDAKLRPGMLLVVTLELGSEQTVMIPEKAVLSLGEIQYVFILQPDGTVSRKEIKPGIRYGGKVEVISGISTGSKIIVEGVSKLVDNSKVLLAEDLDKSKPAINGGNGK